jgi:hypothetical protein
MKRGSFASPALRFGERVDVFLAGAKEIEEIQPLILARLANAQQDQVLFNSLWGGQAYYGAPQPGECFDRMFDVVVVPRNAVVVQEREKFIQAPAVDCIHDSFEEFGERHDNPFHFLVVWMIQNFVV